MLFNIEHFTEYRFTRPVFLEPHQLRFQPRNDPSQKLLRFDLVIDPTPAGMNRKPSTPTAISSRMAWFNDLHTEMTIRATSEVETLRENPFDYLLMPENRRLPIGYQPWEQAQLAAACRRAIVPDALRSRPRPGREAPRGRRQRARLVPHASQHDDLRPLQARPPRVRPRLARRHHDGAAPRRLPRPRRALHRRLPLPRPRRPLRQRLPRRLRQPQPARPPRLGRSLSPRRRLARLRPDARPRGRRPPRRHRRRPRPTQRRPRHCHLPRRRRSNPRCTPKSPSKPTRPSQPADRRARSYAGRITRASTLFNITIGRRDYRRLSERNARLRRRATYSRLFCLPSQ